MRKVLILALSVFFASCAACGLQKTEAVLGTETFVERTERENDDGKESRQADNGGAAEGVTEPAEMDTGNEPVFFAVENPGRGYYFAGKDGEEPAPALKLQQILEKPNAVTDTEEWFLDNGLEDPFFQVPNTVNGIEGNLPRDIPGFDESGRPVVGAGQDEQFLYAVYGNNYWEGYMLKIFDRQTYELEADLDFSSYRYVDETESFGQRLWNAQVYEGVLYASFGHGTYSADAPYHAYVVAVDLSDGKIIWKSEPLVSNAYNFEIAGDVMITGYGFTEEDDFLYQLDLKTGRILEQIPVKSKPDYIIQKDGILYVRTYHTDYQFRIEKG